MTKYLYWRMYQDKESTICNSSVVMTKQDMETEIAMFFDDSDDNSLPPVFEPVMMTEKEFNELPEFDGF